MDRTASVVRLHTQNRFGFILLPLFIGVCAFVIVFVIGFIGTASMGSEVEKMREGMLWNGAIFSMLGPLMGLGAGAMSQFFPLALGLGLTRREFLTGTTLVYLGTALFFAAVITVLKVIEVATHGFGVNIRMFDVVYVGTGPAWQTFVQTLLLLLVVVFLGSALATVHTRFGSTTLWIVLAVFALAGVVVAGVLTIVGNGWQEFWNLLVGTSWAGYMGLIAAIALVCALAWALLIRRAPVR